MSAGASCDLAGDVSVRSSLLDALLTRGMGKFPPQRCSALPLGKTDKAGKGKVAV